MSALPTSWASCSLLECADFVRGVTYTKSDALSASNAGTIPILRANNIQAQAFDWNDLVHVPETLVSKGQELQIGDVVIATSSGSLSVVGKAAQVKSEIRASFGAFCGVLRPNPHIQARYYGHFFSSAHYRSAVSDLARGVNINNLKRDHFQAIQIPIAPLAEQKRIADKLDTVLTRVDAVNTRLARVAPLLKRFRQSVLAAATSGRLTENGKAESERLIRLGDVCKLVNGFAFKSVDYQKSGIPLVRISDITNGRAKGSLDIFIDHHLVDDRFLVHKGDILVAMSGATTGKIGVYESDTPSLLNQRVGNLKITQPDQISSSYRNIAFQALSEKIFTNAYGGAQPNISSKDIEDFEVYLPSPHEQTEIVRRVETLFAFADRLEARLAQAQTAATRLTPALLAKAFRGELVPQDPNDEPAAELLRRLAQAPAAASPRKGRKAAGAAV